MTKAFVISCEYATCAVPEAYREIFDPVEGLVTSPEGWDSGALNLAQSFATKMRTQLNHGNYTRLLIDLDRDGDARWSEYSLRIPEPSRLRLAEREEGVYRQILRDRITDELKRNQLVLHLSVRTTEGSPGRVTLGSFASGSLGEAMAEAWHRRMLIAGLDVGHAMERDDSALAAELGGMFPRDRYAFVRLEVAQSFFLEGRPLKWEAIKKLLLDCLAPAIADVEEALAVMLAQHAAMEPADPVLQDAPQQEVEPVAAVPETSGVETWSEAAVPTTDDAAPPPIEAAEATEPAEEPPLWQAPAPEDDAPASGADDVPTPEAPPPEEPHPEETDAPVDNPTPTPAPAPAKKKGRAKKPRGSRKRAPEAAAEAPPSPDSPPPLANEFPGPPPEEPDGQRLLF